MPFSFPWRYFSGTTRLPQTPYIIIWLCINTKQITFPPKSVYFICFYCVLFSPLFVATPKSPVITAVKSFNTSISLNWTHDRTCFESVPVEYHILLNTTNQPIITDQLMAVIDGVKYSTTYNVSVVSVVITTNGTQKSEQDIEITAGGCRMYICHIQPKVLAARGTNLLNNECSESVSSYTH